MNMKYKVTKVKPQGYCGGVLKAIQMAKECRKLHPNESITILGNLVHNNYVKEALTLYDLKTVEDPSKTRWELLDLVESGIVIFTAHGVNQSVKEKAIKKGLTIVDASCPFVLQTQKIVEQKLNAGYYVFYIGKKGHPEAEAIYSENDRVFLIEKIEDIPKNLKGNIFVTNQTTMSVIEIKNLFTKIKEIYPDASIYDEICNATRVRQEAILALKDQNVDTLIVVGDPSSNNTKKLCAMGVSAAIKNVYRIEDLQQLKPEMFQNARHIAITSGASTPTYLMEQVYEYLIHYPCSKEKIDLHKILDEKRQA